MKKIKIGLVGMGFIADWHYKGFLQNSDAEIIGITQDFYGDSTKILKMKKLLKEKCENWKIKLYENFDSMITDPKIDAVEIGSINPYHLEQIKKAFENKKHVLVEKPVVTDIKHISIIKELMAKSNTKLFPAHNFVYRNSVLKAKKIINEGKLGKIIRGSFVSIHTISETHAKGWRSKRKLSAGGTLMDSGHHLVYQSLFLLGVPRKLHAFISKIVLQKMECEDTAQINLLYPDNSMAVITQSWGSNFGEKTNGIRIVGDKGEIVITDALYFNGEKLDSDVDYGNSFINQAKAFTDFILFDKQPNSTIDDVEKTLKIIYSAYKSSEENKVIEL